MKHLLILLIKLYRKIISPMKPPCCRFYPTCSQYALTAVGRFGFFKGGWLTFKRLVRCNPYNRGGVDYVPESFCFFGKRK